MEITILMPVYNDWDAVLKVLISIASQVAGRNERIGILLIDDGSTLKPASLVANMPHLEAFSFVNVLHLRRNLGHQRAIAVGLGWIYEHVQCHAVIVMDADGEDKPEDVPRLLDAFVRSNGEKAVFAARLRRAEGLGFRAGYHLYRGLHWLLTGLSVRVGNFSIISFEHLSSLVAVSDLWNHYAAAAIGARLPIEMMPTARGRRLIGKSHMNLVALVTHGLSAISVYGETVGTRLLIGSGLVSAALVAVLITVIAASAMSKIPIPGWAAYMSGLLLVALLNVITVAIVLTLLILASRNNMTFVPLRDYAWFVRDCEELKG
jgi:glycosyltransferase involved in cell wall biosynthesis